MNYPALFIPTSFIAMSMLRGVFHNNARNSLFVVVFGLFVFVLAVFSDFFRH